MFGVPRDNSNPPSPGMIHRSEHIFMKSLLGNECQPPILGHWENMTVTEGGTAIFRCPMDAVKSCIAQKVEWFRVNSEGTSEPLKNPRVEVFAFDPLLM